MRTAYLDGSKQEDIARAGGLLARGKLVAIPTETVYGLAASAYDERAVAAIFAAKGRPQDNPLIVHICALSQLDELCARVPEAARRLAAAFWPGPLTMVLPKSGRVPEVVSAGLDSVGVRMPSHPVARAIIECAGVPLAAPSANTSGKPSPTTAAHVRDDLDGRVDAVVDGGACGVGVESTVVDMTGQAPKILRPGAITEEMIAAVLGRAETDRAVFVGLAEGERAKAPGMKYKHYAPRAQVVVYEGAPEDTAARMLAEIEKDGERAAAVQTDTAVAPVGVLCFSEYVPAFSAKNTSGKQSQPTVIDFGSSYDKAAHSRALFAALRAFDRTDVSRILAQCPRPYGREAGAVNRLRKSAGFQTVRCTAGAVVGVTGRSGSGKSYLAQWLAQKGAHVLDADAIYKELLASNAELRQAVLRAFPEAESKQPAYRARQTVAGAASAVPPSTIDRKKLAGVVFSDSARRAQLNAIAHPFVARALQREMAHIRAQAAADNAPPPLIVLDVPLLFESGLDRLCTLTVAPLAPEEASLARIVRRDNLTRGQAAQRLAAQPDDGFYRERCDFTLQNDGGQTAFDKKIAEFYEKYILS